MKDKTKTRIDIRARRTGALRLSVLMLILMAAEVVIVFGLAQVQVRDVDEYRKLAALNSYRDIPIPAVRSPIVDRNGELMAADVVSYRRVRLLNNGFWEEESLEFEEASRLAENGVPAGEYVEAVPKRVYPAGESTAHITGYVGEIGAEELKRWRLVGYRAGERIGKSGLEREYEPDLNGSRGRRILFVNSKGIFLRDIDTEEPLGGPPFRCTIDLRLQEAAYAALREQNKRGAIIFMNSKTGEILAMATSPSFDVNLSSGGFDPEEWRMLHEDLGHPLINRATSVTVPLGSVFKLVVAFAAIEEGIVNSDTKFRCPGHYRVGTRVFHCWKEDGHGTVNIVTGIAESCDVVFYTLGRQLGVTKVKEYAKMLGLGGKTGLDLPGESIGLIPDPEWKKNFRHMAWYEGDTVNLSIGQGYIQVSPVQALVMANVFATRGRLVRPRLYADMPFQAVDVSAKRESIELVIAGMRAAVTRGTAVRFSRHEIPTAGKTGTADDPPRADPHAWYVGFAPADDPVLTYAVFIENGGHGASDALPLAMKVLDAAVELGYIGKNENNGSEKLLTDSSRKGD